MKGQHEKKIKGSGTNNADENVEQSTDASYVQGHSESVHWRGQGQVFMEYLLMNPSQHLRSPREVLS